jgi:hypothetical protein
MIKIEEPAPTGRRAEQAGNLSRCRPRYGVDRHTPHWALNRNKNIGLNLKHDEARRFSISSLSAPTWSWRSSAGRNETARIDYDTYASAIHASSTAPLLATGRMVPKRPRRPRHQLYFNGRLSGDDRCAEGRPSFPHNIIADFAGGGMQGAIGVLAALMARERTGRAAVVDIAMTDGVYSCWSPSCRPILPPVWCHSGRHTARRRHALLQRL